MTFPPRLLLTAVLTAATLGVACTRGDAGLAPVIEGAPLAPDDIIFVASTGEKVDLDEYLEDGVVTVVEFYADW